MKKKTDKKHTKIRRGNQEWPLIGSHSLSKILILFQRPLNKIMKNSPVFFSTTNKGRDDKKRATPEFNYTLTPTATYLLRITVLTKKWREIYLYALTMRTVEMSQLLRCMRRDIFVKIYLIWRKKQRNPKYSASITKNVEEMEWSN